MALSRLFTPLFGLRSLSSAALLVGLLLAALLGACVEPGGDAGPADSRDASFAQGTSAITEGSPEAGGVLQLVNTAAFEVLDVDASLDIRAARNIVAHRDGADGVAGTADDDPFDALAELDAVPWVGPVALERLVAYADSLGYVVDQPAPELVPGLAEDTPEAQAVIELVNTASLATLDDEVPLDARAARNIVAHRDGADRVAGTPDDNPFETLAELDAVPYVGPAALVALLKYAVARGDGAIDSDPPPTGSGLACGEGRCREDQMCVDGACEAFCEGLHVPGDYATIQAAVTANPDGVVCLGPGTFTEDIRIPNGPLNLAIIGTSAERSTIQGTVVVPYGAQQYGNLALRSLGVRGQIAVDSPDRLSVLLSGLRLDGVEGGAIEVSHDTTDFSLVVDGCDLSGRVGLDVFEIANVGDTAAIRLSNSYVHDLAYGIRLETTNANDAPLAVYLEVHGNTFARNETAVSVATTGPQVAVAYANNLFVGNGLALDLVEEYFGELVLGYAANAFWGNTANFDGLARPAADAVRQDLLLDPEAAVPTPLPGSPLLGAGRFQVVHDTVRFLDWGVNAWHDVSSSRHEGADFWGAPRPSSRLDIGAVQVTE